MPTLKPFPITYHDEVDDEESGESILFTEEEMAPKAKPKWYKAERSRRWPSIFWIRALGSQDPKDDDEPHRRARRKRFCRWMLIILVILGCFGVVAAITYISLVHALVRQLAPPKVNSGLQHIVEVWKEPDSNGAFKFEWSDDFSRGIIPKNCHSHNDYWRSVPLYEALAAGCVGIEADIWLTDDKELLVGHSWYATKRERTLRSLYLDPLTNILTNSNVSVASTEEKEIGVFETDPRTSVILLIDFKNNGHDTWPVLLEQLRPLHEKGWLTYFDGSKVINGPLTIVGTGNTPFDLVQQNNTNRFVFFDAPLDDISNPVYSAENSYYASVRMRKAIGRLWFNKLTSDQVDTLKSQIKAAADKGLKSRYWGTPSWPISLRHKVWFTLTDNGVGMLNVDDLASATRWDWNRCVVAGLNLCSSE